ncbi:MAG: hypothetical protein WCV50_04740 [Patescibacteria group bacterium]|jgi:hypothetical protein
MACFIAPTTAAIIVTVARKKIPPYYHIKWLLALLWGGVAWLIPEHIYHGEVVFYPPFFTAGLHGIIPEVLQVGIPMTIAVIIVWLVLVAAATFFKEKKFQLRFVHLMVVGAVIMIFVDKIFA